MAGITQQATAAALLVAIGLANALIDVSALTLLQRAMCDHQSLIGVLGTVEALWWLATGLGAAVAAGVVGVAGIGSALMGIGVALVLLALVAGRGLRPLGQLA